MAKDVTEYRVSTEKEDVDLDLLHQWLQESHWAKDRSREQIERSVETGACFTIQKNGRMVAFARVLTDRVVYGIILDMIVRPDLRGQGLGKLLLTGIAADPRLAELRLVLWTSRATDFYIKAGFKTKPNLQFLTRNWEDRP